MTFASDTSGWFCLKFANPASSGDEKVYKDEYTMSRNSKDIGETDNRDKFLIDLTKILDQSTVLSGSGL